MAAWPPPSRPIALRPTPNVIILEPKAASDILPVSINSATVCDGRNPRRVIGRVNDVMLYPNWYGRGVTTM